MTDVQDTFIEQLSKVTGSLSFAILVYNENTASTISIQKGIITDSPLPENLLPFLKNDKEFCYTFNHDDKTVVLYFLRFNVSDNKYIVIIQDSKKRVRLNKFVSSLLMDMNSKPVPVANVPTVDISEIIQAKDAEIEEITKKMIEQQQDAVIDMAIQEETIKDLKNQMQKMETEFREQSSSSPETNMNDTTNWLKENRELNAEIFRLNEKIGELENEIAIRLINSEDSDWEENKARLESEIAGLHIKIADMENAGLDSNSKNELLRHNAELELEVSRVYRELAELEASSASKFASEHEHNEKLDKENEEFQTELKQVRKQLFDLETAPMLGNDLELKSVMDKMHDEIQVKNDELRLQTSEIEMLRIELEAVQKSIEDNSNSDIAEKDKIIAELTEKLTNYERAQAEITAENERNGSTVEQIDLLKKDKEILQTKLTKALESVKNMENISTDKLKNTISKADHERMVASLDLQISTLESNNEALKQNISDLKSSMIRKEDHDKVLDEVETWKNLRTNFVKEGETLNSTIQTLKNEVAENKETIELLNIEVKARDENTVGYEKSIEKLRGEIKEHLGDIDKLKSELDELTEANNVMRTSQDRFHDLVNNLSQPIAMITGKYKIESSNRSAQVFSGNDAGKITKHECHRSLYNQSERCSWCMFEQAQESKQPALSRAVIGEGENARHLDVLFIPLFNIEGVMVDMAEVVIDKTDIATLNATIDGLKERIHEFKRSHVDDLNTINKLKAMCQELKTDHDIIATRNAKMLKVIERLVSEDKARELLSMRTEVMDIRNKQLRANEMIKNYRTQLEEQVEKYADLNKRVFMQMERILNIINGKTSVHSEEILSILAFLTKEIKMVKKHFFERETKSNVQAVQDAKKAEAIAGDTANLPAGENSDQGFKSEEERSMQKKISENSQQ